MAEEVGTNSNRVPSRYLDKVITISFAKEERVSNLIVLTKYTSTRYIARQGMTIISFDDEDAKRFFERGMRPRKKGWIGVCDIVKRKLDMLHYAKDIKDLRSPPNNRLESLKGNLAGFYSIRVNDQWRIVFKWDLNAHDVQIRDYH